MNCYPSNTAAQYTTKLHHPLSLEGDWEVALTQISVPDMSHNVFSHVDKKLFAQLHHSDRGMILRVHSSAEETL